MKLMTELEDYRRAVPVPVPGRGHPNSSNMSSSPPDRLHKSPSPGSEDENLELSMIKVCALVVVRRARQVFFKIGHYSVTLTQHADP